MKCLLSGEFIRYLGLQANSFSAYYSNSADKHYGKLSIMSAQADFAFFHPPSLTLEGGHEQVCGNAEAGKAVGPYSASSA